MNKTLYRSTLLLSLLMAHNVTWAAPPSKSEAGINIASDRIRVDLDRDKKEYDWWQHNCLDFGIADRQLKLNCDKMDDKYRDHYNRSIHSGNNPGQGHDKQKDKHKGNGKKH